MAPYRAPPSQPANPHWETSPHSPAQRSDHPAQSASPALSAQHWYPRSSARCSPPPGGSCALFFCTRRPWSDQDVLVGANIGHAQIFCARGPGIGRGEWPGRGRRGPGKGRSRFPTPAAKYDKAQGGLHNISINDHVCKPAFRGTCG